MKYILLTGGTGFIGSQLAEDLLNQDKKVILIKRSFSNTERIKNILTNENLILKDIDKEDISNIFSDYDIEGVLHLATYYAKFHENKDIEDMIYSNITFPTILLENAVENNVKYFINTGSFAEYSFDKMPLSENSKIQARNLYASTKVAFEDVLKFYIENYDIKGLTLKLFTPYGPKDDENKIVPYLITKAIKNEKITIRSTHNKLDFIFVEDIIKAFNIAIDKIQTFDSYDSFNIASGKSYIIKEIYEIVENICGKKDVEFLENDFNEIEADTSKINNKLGWFAENSIEDGLKKTIDYYNGEINDI